MKTLATFCLLMIAALGATSEATAPVTRAEAAAVFAKADRVIRSVLKLPSSGAAFPTGSGIATREMIVQHFQAVYHAVEAKFTFTPPPQKSAPQFMSFRNPKTKETAVRLEILGFIDRYGPLVTSKSDGIEPAQFGDALGYFLARIAELTHTPSSKFSPYLMPG